MSHSSDITASAAEAQTTLRLQDAEGLPTLLHLWLPLAVALALIDRKSVV